ncbi:MAG: aldo/keto reductase [Desulfovibrio sp.]|jgi:predicted aldo/keto reductase-like oxidoreductase|nr:aldo/keto reductase [Desulfovibrio sp.]
MFYKDFNDLRLSALGFGNMRLPTLEGGGIDTNKADEMIAYAFENGVNYYDTAYGYHSGESERFIGKSLSRFPRDSWYLASKFPGYEKRPTWDPKEQFEEQLKKCNVEYFDFYMLHNVYEHNVKTYLNPKWNIIDYLLVQKKSGRIRHFGISTHAGTETFSKFIEMYGDEIEFCQIELNALDWTLQDAKAKYEILTARGIPIWVMEPVKGGKLASFSEDNESKLKKARPNESIAAWAFRWLQTLNLGVTLSGMTTLEQVKDNVKTFSGGQPLNDNEKQVYEGIIAGLTDLIPCTACRYCCEGCPQSLDIPTLLQLYNDCRFTPSMVACMAVDAMKPSKRPSACIACEACIEVCPQNINVPEAFKDFQSILDKMERFVPPAEEHDDEN